MDIENRGTVPKRSGQGDEDDDDDDDASPSDPDSDKSKIDSPSDEEDGDDDLAGQSATQLRSTFAKEQLPAWTSSEPQRVIPSDEEDSQVSPPRYRVASTASSDYDLPPPSTDAATSEMGTEDAVDSDEPQKTTRIVIPPRRSASSQSRPERVYVADESDDDDDPVVSPKKNKPSKKNKPKKITPKKIKSQKTDNPKPPGKHELKRRLERPQFEDTTDQAITAPIVAPQPTVWPVWTNLVRNSRNGIGILLQDPRIGAVLRAANKTIEHDCVFVHPYPELNDKSDYTCATIRQHAGVLAPDVLLRMDDDHRYGDLLGTVPANTISQYRSNIACKSAALISQGYGLEGMHSTEIVTYVAALLREHAFLFALKPGTEVAPILSQPFGHPVIVALLKETLFSTCAHLGHKLFPQFPTVDSEKEMPVPILAIIGTVIEVGLMAWSSGTHHPIAFTAEGTVLVYEEVIGFIKYLKDGLTPAQFHRLRANILQASRKSAQTIASSSTVVASHKVDFASMPQ
ncbi:hypothetical protein EUX98_g9622 [Antrodiella citrinella]|uniref:DUF6532 domain-containing protein n=1 Tax=Antrodiella citrinella TaxID=2447956 RepID=A0A4S4LQK0_9APHY|nr:hypothetical protein EUX98_g9622 [Antrodiella citrinella]